MPKNRENANYADRILEHEKSGELAYDSNGIPVFCATVLGTVSIPLTSCVIRRQLEGR